ncbi:MULTISPECIES: photosystem I protein PsaX [Trichocoleus]|uniref:Photosystem I protein PsaX n=1 Tax=Trichocoleus desertorum GB2-A4 TaxID=2933944 RepID=A0ABV0JGD5_9CYAN|nr:MULTISPECIES: photosystem I protein PsaX [unclassified Trichocoleus]MBD1864575.1 photosystem I protein PsaX [Trichocoleus sp. FACHB-46]MBD2096332.1 photosystem I protein PsaX [Trichocoleus sp. FACHB-591]MBD2124704.1 photosystem I protein PsaX [Trichocoleus sp. FACHB-262]
MSAQAVKSSVKTKAVVDESKPPYPYRTIVSLILLAGNFLVAAIYFHAINP